MYDYENGFRYDLKYEAMNAFEEANPKVFMRACIDPSAMEKLTAMEKAVDNEKTEYNEAASESRAYRIASETLAIVEDRMVINQSPRPPDWADNGRGGAFDPRTIYEQARRRIDLKDESYNIQIEQYRDDARETLAQEAVTNHQEKAMSDKYDPIEKLKADVLGIVSASHQKRTELNVWYSENHQGLIEQARQAGADNPVNTVILEQRGRVNTMIADTLDMIDDRILSFEETLGQDLNANQTSRATQEIPEPPSMKTETKQEQDQSVEQDVPKIGYDFLNGSEMEH